MKPVTVPELPYKNYLAVGCDKFFEKIENGHANHSAWPFFYCCVGTTDGN
jgi:hypothetical protein